MRLLTPQAHSDDATNTGAVLQLTNDAELQGLALDGIARIELQFPKFSDGRAFSQAVTLRRRLQFKGDIRATGDVLVDQLVQMQRSGFDSAVLRADQDLDVAVRQLSRFTDFYQGDERVSAPHFRRAA
jgi:uncharacterized protein (DUF934 family)